nr:hypothetical protein BFBNJELC_00032 [uncultured bacterium]
MPSERWGVLFGQWMQFKQESIPELCTNSEIPVSSKSYLVVFIALWIRTKYLIQTL